MDYLSRVADDRRGDIFETCVTKMFFNGNVTGLLEMNAIIFLMDTMWYFGFDEAKRKWRQACQWNGEEGGIKGATAVIVQPNGHQWKSPD